MPQENGWSKYKSRFYLLDSEWQRLRVARQHTGLTWQQVAIAMNMSHSLLQNRIKRNSAFTVDEFGKMCRVLDTTPRWVLTDDDGHIKWREAS